MPRDAQRGKIILDEVFQRMAPWISGIDVAPNHACALIARSAMHNFEMK